MYTIVGKRKAKLFIQKYKECNDEYQSSVHANITIAKFVREEHDLGTPIKKPARGTPKRKSSPKKTTTKREG